ncbi:MAG: hypothetical protein ACYCYE_00985 [Clostridia bacterium]
MKEERNMEQLKDFSPDFNSVEFKDIDELEEVVTPGWGTYYCCV